MLTQCTTQNNGLIRQMMTYKTRLMLTNKKNAPKY